MREVTSDKVYVIAGLVDKLLDNERNYQGASITKANKLGIRAERLPLDKYVKWYKGGKSLTLNQTTGILLDVFHHGDWEKAIREHVPKRKLEPNNHEEVAASAGKAWKARQANLTAMVSGKGRY